MKKIDVKNGLFALVDDEDYEYLSQFKWKAKRKNGEKTFYVSRYYRVGDRKLGKKKQVLMHREILGLTDPKDFADHINHNGLDNRRINLRKCTISENNKNTSAKKNGTSKYLGVASHLNKYWVVNINHNKVRMKTFRYPYTNEGEVEAAKKYDELAKMYHGEFANLNFK